LREIFTRHSPDAPVRRLLATLDQLLADVAAVEHWDELKAVLDQAHAPSAGEPRRLDPIRDALAARRTVIEAIEQATSSPVFGRLRVEEIPRLVGLWGPDRVLAAIAEIDMAGTTTVPVFVSELAFRLHDAWAKDEIDMPGIGATTLDPDDVEATTADAVDPYATTPRDEAEAAEHAERQNRAAAVVTAEDLGPFPIERLATDEDRVTAARAAPATGVRIAVVHPRDDLTERIIGRTVVLRPPGEGLGVVLFTERHYRDLQPTSGAAELFEADLTKVADLTRFPITHETGLW
jgi:hypothetical protein